MTIAVPPAAESAAARPVAEDAPSPPPRTSRLTPTVSATGLLVLLVAVTVHASRPLRNSDTWFHLRIGHELWGGWSLQHPGQLSRFATAPWLPTQWSTEMLAAKAEDWAGLPGVAWLFGALFLAFVVAVYLTCRRVASPLPAVVVTGLVLVGSSPALSARPQVVSLILLTLTLRCWLDAWRTLRTPWWLVPLTWVWATAHGLWSAGVVLSTVCVIGILADRRPGRRVAARLVAVPVLSLAAACLTPVGPRLVLSQVAVGSRTSLIGEWQPTSFRDLSAFVVALMIAVTVAVWARSREVPWTQLLLLLLACGWTALVTRTVSCGAVVVAPLCAGVLQQLLDSRSAWHPTGRRERGALALVVVGLLVALAVLVPHTASSPAGVPNRFGSKLGALPSGSAVLVEGGVGAWIEYRYPALDPTVDGLFDAYPLRYMKAYVGLRVVEPGWTGFVRRSGARVAVTEQGSPLTSAMVHQLHWRVAERQAGYVYLVAPAA